MDSTLYKQTSKLIGEAQNILLIAHRKPDGDTLGSVCAFLNYFHESGKECAAFCVDKVSDNFLYLPLIHKITDDRNILQKKFDLIIILDCGDFKQTGIPSEMEKFKNEGGNILNIDHHFTNPLYGAVNLVNPEAPSATSIVHDFFKEEKIFITKDMATSLLTGIITDTGNFVNAATEFLSLPSVASLLSKGANANKIFNNTLRNKTVDILKLWGIVFSRLQKNKELGGIYSVLTTEDFKEHNVGNNIDEVLGGMANFLGNTQDVDFILLLSEREDNTVSGSLRTMRDDVDVSQIAKSFGGGGHKKAAGFSMPGRLKEVEGEWKIENSEIMK